MPMQMEPLEDGRPDCVALRVSGKLHKQDYESLVPDLELAIVAADGTLRMLVELRDFHGWDVAALWEDLKLEIKHFRDIELLAIVGETRWEKWMTWFSQPFTAARVRYFDERDSDAAVQWILNGSKPEFVGVADLEAMPG